MISFKLPFGILIKSERGNFEKSDKMGFYEHNNPRIIIIRYTKIFKNNMHRWCDLSNYNKNKYVSLGVAI